MDMNKLFDVQESNSDWQGEVGKREEFVLTVTALIPLEMGYAVEIVKFSDLSGNEFVWYASKKSGFEKGESLRVKATVKRHSTFRGVRQTVVNRIKVIGAYIAPVIREQEEDVDVSSEDVAAAFFAL